MLQFVRPLIFVNRNLHIPDSSFDGLFSTLEVVCSSDILPIWDKSTFLSLLCDRVSELIDAEIHDQKHKIRKYIMTNVQCLQNLQEIPWLNSENMCSCIAYLPKYFSGEMLVNVAEGWEPFTALISFKSTSFSLLWEWS